jgi:CysZ protein
VGVFRGVRAFIGGVGWVVSTPRVWLRATVPVATALLLISLLGWFGIREALAIAHRALGQGTGADILAVLLSLAAVVLAIVIGVSLAQPLSGWALAGIVRMQERDLGVDHGREPPLIPATLSSLGSALLGLGVGVPLIVGLTLAAWVFPPDAVVTVPSKFVVAACLLAWDLLDYPLSARGLGLAERLKWCGRNFGAVIGFGLAALAFFAIPGLGLVALPCGVAGAVRLVGSDLERLRDPSATRSTSPPRS